MIEHGPDSDPAPVPDPDPVPDPGPATGPVEPRAPKVVEDERFCVQCSYELRGLPVTGNCPECGTPVARALQGDRLQFSSPDYLGRLSRGALIVIVATVVQMVSMLGGIMIGISAAFRTGLSLDVVNLMLGWMDAGLSLVVILGWWLFSSPDPAILTENTGANARKTLRVCVIISAVGVIMSTAMQQVAYGSPIAPELAASLVGLAQLPAGIAQIVLFFASLLYIRWLARRIPDAKMDADAKRYLWLLPVIYVFGACLLVGPLVATVFYLLILNRVRVAIRDVQTWAPLPDADLSS